jgi:histidinol-phosphate phosphatase family protein
VSNLERTRPTAAVFLDRDGTIIDDAHYIARPELVHLRAGAASAIARLNHAAIPVIIVTNQSGIARGLLTEADFARVQNRMLELLGSAGARVDATYMCPHHPDFGGDCDCRKPGTLLFRRAAREHALDLARSIYIGDRWRDVAPGIALGGRGILIADEHTHPEDRELAAEAQVPLAGSLPDAVARAIAQLASTRASR